MERKSGGKAQLITKFENRLCETRKSVCVFARFCCCCCFNAVRTTVVGEGHHGRDVAFAVLGDDAEAGEGALLAVDVESCVTAVVGHTRVTAGIQKPLH